MDKGIKMFVVPYEPESHLYTTWELWQENERCETFPVLRNTHSVANTGCNHPELLKHPLGERFFWPTTLGKKDYEGPTIIDPVEKMPPTMEEPITITTEDPIV
jgi:hypothetical protein